MNDKIDKFDRDKLERELLDFTEEKFNMELIKAHEKHFRDYIRILVNGEEYTILNKDLAIKLLFILTQEKGIKYSYSEDEIKIDNLKTYTMTAMLIFETKSIEEKLKIVEDAFLLGILGKVIKDVDFLGMTIYVKYLEFYKVFRLLHNPMLEIVEKFEVWK